MTIRRQLFDIIEVGAAGRVGARLFDGFMICLILLNLVAVSLETVADLSAKYHQLFIYFEIFSLTVFSIEYLLRLWVCVEYAKPYAEASSAKTRFNFALSPLMIIDFLAIVPSILSSIFGLDMRVLRVFRLLRIFKLTRYSPALASLGSVIYQERRALIATVIIMVGLALFASTAIYHMEHELQPDKFSSIPASMWWALATLTTVGYGDMVPLTTAGRVFGSMIMVFGVAMFTLPIGIMASGFANEIHRRDFVVRWGLVANIPLFRGLDAALITIIAKYLRSRLIQEGTLIARKGEDIDCLYMIVSGEVIRRAEGQDARLEEGGFFGAQSLMDHSMLEADYVALSRCQLLVLEADDFHHLLQQHKSLKRRIEEHYHRHAPVEYGQPEDVDLKNLS